MLQKLSNNINMYGNQSILRPRQILIILISHFYINLETAYLKKKWVYSMSPNFRSSSSFMRQKKHFRTESYVSLNLNICLQYWQAQKGSMVTSETGNKV